MLGNVFEWVKPDSDIIYDRYVECYGGYWRDENCSVNSAISEEPNNRLGGNIGFRIALVPIE